MVQLRVNRAIPGSAGIRRNVDCSWIDERDEIGAICRTRDRLPIVARGAGLRPCLPRSRIDREERRDYREYRCGREFPGFHAGKISLHIIDFLFEIKNTNFTPMKPSAKASVLILAG